MALRPGLRAGGGGGGGGGGSSSSAVASAPPVTAGPAAPSSVGGAGLGSAGGSPGPASFMFPVASGLGPQGMIHMPGFSMVSVMQPSMQGMMGMNYSSQMPPGTMAMQGGMPLGPMPTAGMSYVGQAPFLGMRPAAPQYTQDMQKQFVEEQQKRFEHQQKFLEEERKRRQFEEQKQKLRLLSSVKPKIGEKSRDDALEAIKGNLDGFSRDAKLHPTPTSHPKNAGVGVFPAQDQIQQLIPPWIYNDNLVPDLYKKILETTLTPAGIDTGKLYPILMSSGLPRETLGQIWALANRTTPGKLTKEELYTVLAMIALTQRGVPAMSPDGLNQFPSAPIPTLSRLPMAIPVTVSQQSMLPPGPPLSMPLSMGPAVVRMSLAAPVGGASAQAASSFGSSYPANQAAKPDDDDFQDFQDASKSGGLDDSFTDFQGEVSGMSKATAALHRSSAPSMLIPLSGAKMPPTVDKYAVFKGIAADKPTEGSASLGDHGDKYSAFRVLEQPPESKPLGDSFAEFKSAGTDDGFTDFKTSDSISPLDLPPKDKTFPLPFSSLPAPSKQQPQGKPSLYLADLDLFSSASAGENRPLPFPATYNSPKQVSFPVAPPPTSATATAPLPMPSNSSILANDFADFNLFGGLSNCTSATTQDEFADFMAFSNSAGSSELKPEGKYSTLKQDGSPGPPAGSLVSTVKSGQSPAAASTKYDIFKQLSLDGPSLGFEELKDHTPSSVKSEDDFADFHLNKFSSSSEKSLVDKLTAFKHAKEDSASVKSLDLPSIGGSSVGKEDSEDALSAQFDMKLADVGGDLKHVMSDSSLDLPTISGQHPPAADFEDLKCATFGSYSNGSALSSFPSYDWSDKDDGSQSRKSLPFPSPPGSGSSLATSVLRKKETLFGSSENITMTTVSKVTTFASEDSLQDVTFSPFANFKEPDSRSVDQSDDDVESFGKFARPLAETSESPAAGTVQEVAGFAITSLEAAKESADDFGEFQSEKPKISKFDFLLATSQGKVKSSEEMIKSELATFDLSVQGSHKRSLSLGDREISRSSPLPPPEQPFRDRSNTLSEKPALPVIRDKYKDLTGEVEESERYAYEWQRCLESALQVIKKANNTLNGISSSSVCTEVIQSAQGMEYLLGVVEVYRVTKRVELGIKATAVCSEKLQLLLKDIDKVWNNLIGFMSLAALTPDENSLDFSSCMLRPGIKNAQELACGVCLLNVNSRSKKEEKPAEEHPKEAFNSETDNFKLAYGGHQYHATCANFWINCVEPKPPGLILPDLL
ncbi:synergin gamma isoform X5 [Rhineura floridana]|uniref:synergin gamma isoform X5 n=1 Tax=Rhineura floridana TaxID=261503 RepID=UPI002AC85B8D|nr:synergin gamma isoform X5 [Rhineura floridana]